MRSYLAAFFIAAITSAFLTPFVRRFAIRVGAVSTPGGRHIHGSPIARIGGVGMYLAFLVPIAAVLATGSSVSAIVRHHPNRPIGLLVGCTAMMAVGLYDDLRGLRAIHKLGAQIAVAFAAFVSGFRIETISLPCLGDLSMGIFACPVTILWIVGIVNAVNLIDGLDGLAGGIVLFASITNFVIAMISGSVFIAFVMAALIGTTLGFLLFNFNPARIFMGDSGSYFLGFALSTTVLVGASQKTSTAVTLLVPCLALGVPIFDTLFSMVRRYLERRPIFSPDRGHIHHRLLDMGVTHRRAVLLIYGVSAVLSVAAIALALGEQWQTGVALVTSSVVFFALVRFAGYFTYLQRLLRLRGSPAPLWLEVLRKRLPELPEHLARVEDLGQLWVLVCDLGKACDLTTMQARSRDGSHILLDHTFSTADAPEAVSLIVVPIGDAALARAELVLAVPEHEGRLAPELHVLADLLGRMIGRALSRLGSQYAPAADAPTVSLRQATAPSGMHAHPSAAGHAAAAK